MPKEPGTPDGVGLVHMPLITPAPDWKVDYEQVGGFGPISRDLAFAAIKVAGNIGHARPDTVWIQRGKVVNGNLEHAITAARKKYRIVEEIEKDGDKANEGWGIYYQFGRTIIVEHTSDPNSVVKKPGTPKEVVQMPHFHVETAGPDSVAATGRGHTFKVERVERMGSASPLSPGKTKLNHHLYYIPLS